MRKSEEATKEKKRVYGEIHAGTWDFESETQSYAASQYGTHNPSLKSKLKSLITDWDETHR